MSDEASRLSVAAHTLLNELSGVHGLLASALEQLDPDAPGHEAVTDLLQRANGKTAVIVEALRRYVAGLPEDARPEPPTIDLRAEEDRPVTP